MTLKIALDFDDTYTADPELFGGFLVLCGMRDIDVRIVTFRDEELHGHPGIDWLRDKMEVPVIFTNGNAKKGYCRDKHGWEPNIWIDDKPRLIDTQISAWTREENEIWAKEVNEPMIKEWKEKYPERCS